jgi:hypothetical protein
MDIDQFVQIIPSFTLECGRELRNVPVAYKTWGTLNTNRDNVMVICHAFTGNADVQDWYVTFELVIVATDNIAGGVHSWAEGKPLTQIVSSYFVPMCLARHMDPHPLSQ